jgi:catechol 2,3-dioxygenase-like lactoylglutathione lyase family enzyme
MPVTLNHTIVHAKDNNATAKFLTDLLNLEPHRTLGHFAVVQVGPTSIDFIQTGEKIEPRHFAFQVSEKEFDEIFARIRDRAMPYWADPFRRQPNEINHWDDGRGVYFEDPNSHLLEILTRSYGSGGLTAKHVNPLLPR